MLIKTIKSNIITSYQSR